MVTTVSTAVPARPSAVHNAAAALQTRFGLSSGTPASGTSAQTGPGDSTHTQRVVQLDRLEDRAQLVVPVRPGTQHAQVEVDLRVGTRGDPEPFARSRA